MNLLKKTNNSTTKEVKVCKLADPYLLLVYDVKDYNENLDEVNFKISKLVNNKRENLPSKLEKGSVIIVRPFLETGIHWNKSKNFQVGIDGLCRGLVINYQDETRKYSIYLLDVGVTIPLTKNSIVKVVTKDEIDFPHLVYPIGLNNILPAEIEGDSFVVQRRWSKNAIDLMKQLIEVSKKCFFQHITTNTENGLKLGELNLLINNEFFPMRKLLALNKYATPYPVPTCDSRKPKTENNLNYTNEDDNDDDILISSKNYCKRLNDIYEARFNRTIHKSLFSLGVTVLRKIQEYIWPAINKNLNVLAVGPRDCGKTLGWVTPIANIIVNIKKQQHKHYPLTLVLTSSSNNVLYIHDMFNQLFNNYHSNIEVVGAFNGCNQRNIIASVYNKSKIFVTTPPYLLRFLNQNAQHKEILKFNYIKHLVVDDLDKVLMNYSNDLKVLLSQFVPVKDVQVIGASKTWSVAVKEFVSKFMEDPYICVRSFSDAAIYCGVKFKPRLIAKENKPAKVQKFLSKHYEMVKTMIICANDSEANELRDHLMSAKSDMNIIYIDSKTDILKIPGIKKLWACSIPGTYPLMICTDDVLSTLGINDIIWLIHYSIDVPSKTAFLLRFSTLMMHIKKKTQNLQVTIVIDDTNDLQLRGIVDLLERSGHKFEDKSKLIFQKIYTQLDSKKQSYPVCNNIKSFGNCFKQTHCPFRHSFLKLVDKPTLPFIEVGCSIKIQYNAIYYIHNTNHYSVRVDEYVDLNGQTQVISKENFAKITTKVFHYYSDKTNRLISKKISIGGLYAYDNILDQFERVQVINIDRRDNNYMPLYVDLRAVDSGNIFKRVRVSRLLNLPEELANEPSRIVEVYLSNIGPFDGENEWNIHAKNCVTKWFETQARDKTYLLAKVCLNIGNNIWVDSLESCLKTDKRKLVNDSLKSHLITREHAIINNQHIENLRKLWTD